MITTDRIVNALQKVPEKTLRLIEITRELTGENGELQYEKIAGRKSEINLALAEAKAYAGATNSAVEALKRIPARGGSR